MRAGARLGAGLAGAVLALDQLTKWWILERVMTPPQVFEITPFFNIVLVWNRGVSFGLFNNDSPYNQWVLSALAIVISIFLIVWMVRAETRWIAAATGLIIGGAIGNVVDRLRFGAVVDFLDVHAAGYHWPAFNVADAAICVGAGILIADSLFGGARSE